jgi:DNA-binding protein YbaB
MTDVPSADDLDRELSQARRMLLDLRRDPGTGAAADDEEPVRGEGQAADGMVKVTVEGGRISKVDLNPRAMRLASEDLGKAFASAANAALAEFTSKATSEVSPVADPAALAAQLAELQDYSVRQMARYSQAMSDVVARLGRSG